MRTAQLFSGALVVIAAVICIVLPIMGVQRLFEVFQLPFSRTMQLQLLGEQLIGPIFLLAAGLSLLGMTIYRKRTQVWLGFCGLLATVYTVHSARAVSHDFSHSLFQQCSSIYGKWVMGCCIAGAAGVVALCLLEYLSRKRASGLPVGNRPPP